MVPAGKDTASKVEWGRAMKLSLSWHHPALYVAESYSGCGVFTKKHLRSGIVIARLGGHVMTLEQERQLPPPLCDYPHQIDDDYVLGPCCKTEVGLTDHFNHSCAPNIGFRGQIFFVTMQPITSKSELTFDYAMCISGEPYEIDCTCGRRRCRSKITADDWRNPVLQKRYSGYFQPYLAAKITRLKD